MTVYAFSIDNFRRESEEVDALMTLAEEKLLDLLNVSLHLYWKLCAAGITSPVPCGPGVLYACVW